MTSTDKIPSRQDEATRRNNKSKNIHNLSQKMCNSLDVGIVVNIVNVAGEVVTKMRLAVFKAASTKPELYSNGQIHLPDTIHDAIHEQAVKWLIQELNKLAEDEVAGLKNAFRDFHLCFVAEVMGMRKYTQNIFNEYYYPLKDHSLAYEHLLGISKVENALGRKFLKDVAYDLATLAWNEAIPNPAVFDYELATNAPLANSVNNLFKIWENAARRTDTARLAKIRQEEEDQHYKELEAKEKVRKAKKAAQDKATSEAKQKKEIELRERIIKKKRTGEKLTHEEARMHYIMYGKRVPI
ncbi:uncharacterized protein K460DRAFT_407314 [Cucurbitaria berberidis CBS 394.84]|uniref:Uncharacterized protein n=1 Tax=Cucurbitaria berberidis CBS 394.84 TaxID=1168544 RepID=A0A9P4GC67_9PLEO|nr:uncharacterized protein K460DRAFT_407314 [Cucurbitaria berberidis CBS 394.84]KAF1842942.1 hypothetical protein K460DRAFT_407314 [Cucurbitaria berberidis CBS 394.84]